MGHHHGHIYAVQVVSLLLGLLLPGGVLALLLCARLEGRKRPVRSGAGRAQAPLLAHLASLVRDQV